MTAQPPENRSSHPHKIKTPQLKLPADSSMDLRNADDLNNAGQTSQVRQYQQELDQLSRAKDHARDQLRACFEASNKLVQRLNPMQMLQEIVELARLASDATWVGAIKIERDEPLKGFISAHRDPRFEPVDQIRRNGLSMQVYRTKKSVILPDLQAATLDINPSMFVNGVRSAICLPLSAEGNAHGVVWIHYDQPHNFDESEIQSLQFFVNQAALAYNTSRQLEQMEWQRQVELDLFQTALPVQVCEKIANYARKLLGARGTAVRLYDTGREEYVTAGEFPLESRKDEEGFQVEPGGVNNPLLIEKAWVQNQSLLRVKLGVPEETIGELAWVQAADLTLEDEALQRLRVFVDTSSFALKQARLVDQLRRSQATARAIARKSTGMDLRRTLQDLLEELLGTLPCDAVTLYIWNLWTKELESPPYVTGLRHPAGTCLDAKVKQDSLVLRVLERDEPYVAAFVPADPLFATSRFSREEEINALMALPLLIRGEGETNLQKIGVLFINYRTPHRFTLQERELIQFFADLAAVAIYKAQLLHHEREQAKQFHALYEAGQAINSSLGLEDIQSRIAQQAQFIAGNNSISTIRFVEGDHTKVVVSYPKEKLARTIAAVGQELSLTTGLNGRIGITGRAVKTGVPQNVPNVREDPDYLMAHKETRSELVVPIRNHEQQVIGVINVESPIENAFTTDLLDTMVALAAQAGTAIENARIHQELKDFKARIGRRTVSDFLQMMNNEWRHEIRHHMAYGMNQVVKIRRALAQPGDTLEHELVKLEEIISHFQDIPIQAPLDDGMQKKPIKLNQLLQDHFSHLWKHAQFKDIALVWKLQKDLDDRGTVLGSSQWILRGLDKLAINAAEAMAFAGSRKRRIVISTRLRKQNLEIRIQDSGPRWAAMVRPERFWTPCARSTRWGFVMACVSP